MNIFVLDPDPAVAASYHCDQHLHKMILESAQMLSTAMHTWYPNISKYIYKPTHANHPCTKWVMADLKNALWLTDLMLHLDNIRMSLGADTHKSMQVRDIFIDNNDVYDLINLISPDSFIFCGPEYIANSTKLSTVIDKYKMFYRFKQYEWKYTPKPMTYKNRPIPDFMKDLIK